MGGEEEGSDEDEPTEDDAEIHTISLGKLFDLFFGDDEDDDDDDQDDDEEGLLYDGD